MSANSLHKMAYRSSSLPSSLLPWWSWWSAWSSSVFSRACCYSSFLFLILSSVVTCTAMRASLVCLGLCAAAAPSICLAASNSSCKCFPGDGCWPSDETWASLNTTVGGRLIKTVPLAQSCHDPTFDNGTCTTLQDGWENPTTQ